jgi:hypothetical protein
MDAGTEGAMVTPNSASPKTGGSTFTPAQIAFQHALTDLVGSPTFRKTVLTTPSKLSSKFPDLDVRAMAILIQAGSGAGGTLPVNAWISCCCCCCVTLKLTL